VGESERGGLRARCCGDDGDAGEGLGFHAGGMANERWREAREAASEMGRGGEGGGGDGGGGRHRQGQPRRYDNGEGRNQNDLFSLFPLFLFFLSPCLPCGDSFSSHPLVSFPREFVAALPVSNANFGTLFRIVNYLQSV
jgi:hypothetical protein